MMSTVPTTPDAIEFSQFTDIRKQLFLNSGLLGLSRFLSTSTALVTVPVVLSKLGPARTGAATWRGFGV